MNNRSGRELSLMSLSELAAVVNNPAELGPERAKVASCLHSRLGELNGVGWLMLGFDGREALDKALCFDTSQHIFQ